MPKVPRSKSKNAGKSRNSGRRSTRGFLRAEKAHMYLLMAHRRPRATARAQLRQWAGVLSGRRLGRPARRRRGSSSAHPSPAALSFAYRQERDSVRGEERRRDAIFQAITMLSNLRAKSQGQLKAGRHVCCLLSAFTTSYNVVTTMVQFA